MPGDVVELRAGDRAPADLRLLESHGLQLDEAPLTGESAPVLKQCVTQAAKTPLADRAGMAFSGTMVTAGQGLGVVCATGTATEIGRISGALAQVEELTTPLLRQIAAFARVLTVVILLLAAFTVAAGAWLHGLPISEDFLAGVALAVADIPKGLPAIITITLAIGVRRMSMRQAIILCRCRCRRRRPAAGQCAPWPAAVLVGAEVHGQPAPGRICLKGAPEKLMERCSQEWTPAGERSFDRAHWQAHLDALAADGMRVLAIAHKPVEAAQRSLSADDVQQGLCMLGLVGFEDPPRPEVPAAIRACRAAGISVKMITGDHAAIAGAIAAQLDIGGDGRVISGPELDAMDDAELQRCVTGVHVYARTTPVHKLRLVTALQAQNRVVAMTGDGANDAPALERANIGVAMGIKGTEAARQASEMVLADDNFATIVSGVEEERGVYDNIRKALLFILPTNAAQALVVMLAVLAGLTLPMTPVQILWINMAVTLALSLAFEPLEGQVMRRPPRPAGGGLLTPLIGVRIATVGLLLTAGTFGSFAWIVQATGDLALARTTAVNVLVAGQIFYLFNARRWLEAGYTREALTANRWAWGSVALLLVMQAVITYLPAAQAIFGTTGLPALYWPPVLAFGLAVFAVVELEKALLRRWGADNSVKVPAVAS